MEIEDRICCCVSGGLGQWPLLAAHLLEQSPRWPSRGCIQSISMHSRPSSHTWSVRHTHHSTNAVVPCTVRKTLVTWPGIRELFHCITFVNILGARADEFLLSKIPRQAVGAQRLVTVQVQSQICERAVCNTSILPRTVTSKPSEDLAVLKPQRVCRLIPVAVIMSVSHCCQEPHLTSL